MNEEYDVQTPVTDVTENTEAQSVEENEEGIELTDTTSQEEEKQEVKTYTAEEVEKMVNDRLNTLLPKKNVNSSSPIFTITGSPVFPLEPTSVTSFCSLPEVTNIVNASS